MRPFLLLVFLPLLFSCASAPKGLKPSVIELPDLKIIEEKDLDSVREEAGNKRVVMLGESIHITSEFSKVRDILIRDPHLSSKTRHHGTPLKTRQERAFVRPKFDSWARGSILRWDFSSYRHCG